VRPGERTRGAGGEKNRERIREYDRKWRKRNPDKVKEYEEAEVGERSCQVSRGRRTKTRVALVKAWPFLFAH